MYSLMSQNIDRLEFQAPERVQGMFGRVALATQEVTVCLSRSKVISEAATAEKHAILFGTDAAATDARECMSRIDRLIVATTKQEAGEWFPGLGLDVDDMEAMYVPCSSGARIRVCLAKPIRGGDISWDGKSKYDIVLSLVGICFDPQSFYPVWRVERSERSASYAAFFKAEVEEEDEDAARVPMPTDEDARRIRRSINDRLSAEADRLRTRLDRVQASLGKLQAAPETDLAALLAVHDEAQQ